MTAEVLHSPSHFPSSPSSSLSCVSGDGPHPTQSQTHINRSVEDQEEEDNSSKEEDEEEEFEEEEEEEERKKKEEDQLSLLALLVTVCRKSLVACRTGREELCSMEISWPTNVEHVAHVTFDRFNGFLGLPVEFEPEVPRRAPSASASVFGVSTESMQCSFDSRGNSVPTIILLMQRRLYAQGGLQAEGIFRINAENSQEEYVRDQLNRGIVPDGIDVHCLAGLIKAWFRELPSGVLDSLAPEQVMQCQSEDECAQLVRLLPPTEAALMDWAINLMADVVQEEQQNKMNAHNVAMVFAPNMTQMADPLTALMYAVQVMNFLKTLIVKTLKERNESALAAASVSHSDPSDENGHHSPSQPCLDACREEKEEHDYVANDATLDGLTHLTEEETVTDGVDNCLQTSCKKATTKGDRTSSNNCHCEAPVHDGMPTKTNRTDTNVNAPKADVQTNNLGNRVGQSSNSNLRKGLSKVGGQSYAGVTVPTEKSRGTSIVSRINSRVERVEAWR